MQYHLRLLGDKIRETFEYADFESLEIFGSPNDELMAWLERAAE